LNLNDHAEIASLKRALIVKLDVINPALEKCAAPDLVALEADATQSAKARSVSRRDTLHEGFEVAIPRDNDGRQAVANRGDDRIWSAGWQNISYESNVMSARSEELRH
jgi:hypothetical protein